MFPSHYFPKHYFAGRYFPPVSGGVVTPPPVDSVICDRAYWNSFINEVAFWQAIAKDLAYWWSMIKDFANWVSVIKDTAYYSSAIDDRTFWSSVITHKPYWGHLDMGIYQPGDSVRVLFYTRDQNDALTDGNTVNIYLRNAAGIWTTYTYGVDSVLTKLSTGTYQLLVYVPAAGASSGSWKYEGQAVDGSGNSLTVTPGGFEVARSERFG